MIAETLQQSVTRLRAMLSRNNGDLALGAPAVLDDLEADIERVRGLETVAEIRADILDVYAEGVKAHFGCSTEAINGRA